ncbi:hypothetical protein [Paenibacillus sp. FJAT-26967]|uniref:hypothetical protein n=1 Tax=Paenibacillus sp. FJAT-26967 TaxID=1729690 RepID=UPI000839211A|nr:hypothetical protein [Paenibacillus sp. FJAT-26967]
MFGSFYFGGCSEWSEFKETILRLLEDAGFTDSEDEFTVSTNGFTLFFQEGGHGVVFASEDYGVELKYNGYIDIIVSYPEWAFELMEFTGRLLTRLDGDCVLELNDKPILLRKDKVVCVDDKKLSGTARFPFHGLNLDYVEGDLS